MPISPFAGSTSKPGCGVVHLKILPPATPTFSTLSYTYPLKLLPSAPHILPPSPNNIPKTPTRAPERPVPFPELFSPRPISVPLLFLLSYGGGLLPPDTLSLTLTLDPATRLTIATQGSTKIYPSPPSPSLSPDAVSPPSHRSHLPSSSRPSLHLTASQTLNANLQAHSALWLAPDPTQPFVGSHYVQRQIFDVVPSASLGLLDWVTEGRRARGESWVLGEWRGVNEVWRNDQTPQKAGDSSGSVDITRRLLLRDTLHLSPPSSAGGKTLSQQMEGMGIFGTLILLGPVFTSLADFFIEEFEKMPRIGGRDWGDIVKTGHSNSNVEGEISDLDRGELSMEQWRKERIEREKIDGVLWNAARVRGCVVVKFAAREAEGARSWVGAMVGREGSVRREFGDGGLMALR